MSKQAFKKFKCNKKVILNQILNKETDISKSIRKKIKRSSMK